MTGVYGIVLLTVISMYLLFPRFYLMYRAWEAFTPLLERGRTVDALSDTIENLDLNALWKRHLYSQHRYGEDGLLFPELHLPAQRAIFWLWPFNIQYVGGYLQRVAIEVERETRPYTIHNPRVDDDR